VSDAKIDLTQLDGAQKAAVFMLAIGETHAAALFEKMDDDEIRSLSQSMAHLGAVKAGVIETLLVEFSEQVASAGSLIGTFESTERLLSKILERDRVQKIMEEIRGPSGRTMWDKLGNVNEAVLANYLKNEYPQTVAVVLSRIRSAHAARVLALLPEGFATEVVLRMLRMETVQKDILEQVERTLRSEFMTNLARTSRRESHEVMADIFNNLDRATEQRFMSALEERSSELAGRIKQFMFSFDDLLRIDNAGVQVILRQVSKEQLAVALKGASDEIKDLFLRNMSERAGKMLKEDIGALGPVRLRDVEEAQSNIVAVAKAMADAGEIVIADGSGSADELVY
jgi:flagellar motor switch protein FliG